MPIYFIDLTSIKFLVGHIYVYRSSQWTLRIRCESYAYNSPLKTYQHVHVFSGRFLVLLCLRFYTSPHKSVFILLSVCMFVYAGFSLRSCTVSGKVRSTYIHNHLFKFSPLSCLDHSIQSVSFTFKSQI